MQKEEVVLGGQLEEKFEQASLTKEDFFNLIFSSFYLTFQIVIVMKIMNILILYFLPN